MSKILVSSDFHINDYRNHNIEAADTPKNISFRLYQFSKLFDMLGKVVVDQGCEHVILCGDVFDKALPPPSTFNLIVKKLQELAAIPTLKNIYLIHGNHDLNTKNSDISAAETYVFTTDLVPKVSYVHDQTINIDGKDIYFLGWVPDIENYSANCDVFVGHLYINGATLPNNIKIENSNNIDKINVRDCAFIGDIHKPQVVGKNTYIPGCPIPNSFADANSEETNAEKRLLIYSTDTGEVESIPTDTYRDQFKFLRFYKTSDDEEAQRLSLDNYNVVYKINTVARQINESQASSNKLTTDIIAAHVKQNNLQDIYAEALKISGVSDNSQAVNFNFHLESIKMVNFKSIVEYEMKFDEGVNLVVGKNGSGKSSFVEAMKYALYGTPKDTSLFKNFKSKEFYVTLKLKYNNADYEITRGYKSAFFLDIIRNGEKISKSISKDDVALLEEEFPFLNNFLIFLQSQTEADFFSNYNSEFKLNLIKNIFSLDDLFALSEAAIGIHDGKKAEIVTVQGDVSMKENSYNQLVESDSSVNIKRNLDVITADPFIAKVIAAGKIAEGDTIKSISQTAISQLRNYVSQIDAVEMRKKDLMSKGFTEEYIENEYPKLDAKIYKYETEIDKIVEKINKLNETTNHLNGFKYKLKNLYDAIETTETSKARIQAQIDNAEPGTCTVCGSVVNQEEFNKQMDAFRNEIKIQSDRLVQVRKDVFNDIHEVRAEIGMSDSMTENTLMDKEQMRIFIAAKESEVAKAKEENNARSKRGRDLIYKMRADRTTIEDATTFLEASNITAIAVTDFNNESSTYNSKIDALDAIDVLTAGQTKLNEYYIHYNNYQNHNKLLEEYKEGIKLAKAKEAALLEGLGKYELFSDILNPKKGGQIFVDVLNEIAKILSDDYIKFSPFRELVSKKGLKLDIDLKYKVEGLDSPEEFIDYNHLSGGQKVMASFRFLFNLLNYLGRIPIMIFDESFAALDEENLVSVMDLLGDLQVDSIFVISHFTLFSNYNTRYEFALTGGQTKIVC